MKFDPEIHHRHSIRLKGYDYSREGIYFIMVCTKNRIPLFGTIENGIMRLNQFGLIVEDEWIKTGQIREGLDLGARMVMPNHFHANLRVDPCRGTARRAPAATIGNPIPGSLATIIRSFKSASTKRINDLRGTRGATVWQRNYYEHIIRDDEDYERITEYILSNPLIWEKDKLFTA